MRARRTVAAAAALLALGVGSVAVAAGQDDPRPSPRATAAALGKAPGKPGTVTYNRWLGRSFNDTLLNERRQSERIKILRRIVSPRYIQHNPLAPEGREGLVAFIPVIYASFPDVRFTVRDVIATKNRVVTRWTWKGTLTGEPFLGVPARGQKVEFDAIDIWTVRDGKLYEHWDQFDWTRAIHQLTDDDKLPQPFVDAAERPVDR